MHKIRSKWQIILITKQNNVYKYHVHEIKRKITQIPLAEELSLVGLNGPVIWFTTFCKLLNISSCPSGWP